MKTKNIIYPFLVIILCLFGWSCTTTAVTTATTTARATKTARATITPFPKLNPKLKDTWLIGTEDCRPPCWNGIIPGETTFDEALNVIQSFGFINKKGEIRMGEDESYISWYRGDGKNAYIKFFENKVILMHFFMLSGDLGSVVDHFGEPDGYTVIFDDPGIFIEVFYPNYGLVFEIGLGMEDLISQDKRVKYFWILSPEDPEYFYSSYLHNKNIIYDRGPGFIERQIYYEWEGFGVDPWDKLPKKDGISLILYRKHHEQVFPPTNHPNPPTLNRDPSNYNN